MFSFTLSGGFQRGVWRQKGPWIFILIVQINCSHLHSNRWTENKGHGVVLFGQKPRRCYGNSFLKLEKTKGAKKKKESHANVLNVKCSLLGAVKRCLRVIWISVAPALKGFKDALWLLCAYPLQRPTLTGGKKRAKPGNNYSARATTGNTSRNGVSSRHPLSLRGC